jgi:hypothetical protein
MRHVPEPVCTGSAEPAPKHSKEKDTTKQLQLLNYKPLFHSENYVNNKIK